MKTLILARHAKSSWDSPGQSDFERPLNARGLENAPLMAGVLKQYTSGLDSITTSNAARALATAEFYASATGLPLQQNADLYLASFSRILQIARQHNNAHSSLMLVGHNPGMTEAVNALSGAGIDNMPTCSFAVITFESDDWASVSGSSSQLLAFEYPKKYSPS